MDIERLFALYQAAGKATFHSAQYRIIFLTGIGPSAGTKNWILERAVGQSV